MLLYIVGIYSTSTNITEGQHAVQHEESTWLQELKLSEINMPSKDKGQVASTTDSVDLNTLNPPPTQRLTLMPKPQPQTPTQPKAPQSKGSLNYKPHLRLTLTQLREKNQQRKKRRNKQKHCVNILQNYYTSFSKHGTIQLL